MKTSFEQFAIMVNFMEIHGDLSKCKGIYGSGPEQRLYKAMKWTELTNLLNNASGASCTELRWHRIWSHFKNHTRRKWQKLNCPDVFKDPQYFTELEIRVLIMMYGCVLGTADKSNSQIDAAEDDNTSSNSSEVIEVKAEPEDPSFFQVHTISDDDSSRPGCSTTPSDTTQRSRPESPEPIHSPAPKSPTPPSSPTPSPQPEVPASPPPRKKRRGPSIVNYLLTSERRLREDARERERLFAELERERIRQRDVELRQRDTEILLQGQWIEFMKSGLNVLEKYLDKK